MNNERRKKIKYAISLIETAQNHLEEVQSDEENAYDNMPEGLQDSLRGMDSQEAIDILEEAISNLEDIVDSLGDIPGM